MSPLPVFIVIFRFLGVMETQLLKRKDFTPNVNNIQRFLPSGGGLGEGRVAGGQQLYLHTNKLNQKLYGVPGEGAGALHSPGSHFDRLPPRSS